MSPATLRLSSSDASGWTVLWCTLSERLAMWGRDWDRLMRSDYADLPEAAIKLLERADAYEATQPSYAADLREAARRICA